MTTLRSLSAIRSHGPWRIAAIEETETAVHAFGHRVAAQGGKRPLAILIEGPQGLHGTDLEGRALPLGDIEALLPGALDRLAGRAGRNTGPDNTEENRT
ncbi:hypothetical protein P6F26_06445 [Roseibacterium sp. SDUM158017]|uniref:hypothetical protein n=1 Tax=Roseicyclus salinarum TaxID=3036773 RepID=UPI0024150962|nr:hypothetical protein [Roseibacterium sp. SDUM158017]MDG4648075.1 hypothetical protein [Roseibacterium sp. SDUM158017]